MVIIEVVIAVILGAFVGRLMAMVVHFLPAILLEGCDQGREPRDMIKWFFRQPFCWDCQRPMSNFAIYPILGIFFLKKCLGCQHPIERKRLFLELGVALLFGVTTLIFGFSVPLLFVWAMTCLLVCCFVTDFEHGILPDQLTLALVWLGLIGSLYPVFITPQEAIVGAIVGYGVFYMFNHIYQHYRHRDGMFPGDFKLNAGVGACLGVEWLIPILIYSLLLLLATAFVRAFFVEKVDIAYLRREVAYACYLVIIALIALYYHVATTPGFGH